MAGVLRTLYDGLTNVLSGLGTTSDPRSYNRYRAHCLSDQEIDAAFRGSWLMRKIITKPAAEMVREWRDWQTDKPNIEKLEAEEKRLAVQAKVEQALILAGLGGAGMVIYTADVDQTQPLDPERIRANSIIALHVWHRSCFALGPMIEAWDDPWFGHPSYYEMQLGNTRLQLHPSRVIAFRGHPTSGIATASWNEWWWGDSTVQVVKDAVDNVHTGEDGFGILIRQAKLRRLYKPKMTEMLITPDGEARFRKRLDALGMGENTLGITFLDAGDGEGKGGEEIKDVQVSWAGIPEIKASYLATAAAAANMPATVLLGKSPDGMNATGNGDLTVWEQEVKSRQDLRLRPCLDQLDVALVPSALGQADPKLWWKFAPLSTPTEAQEADTFGKWATGVKTLMDTGLLPELPTEKAIQNTISERGWLVGFDEAVAAMPDDERFPSLNPDPAEPDPSDLQAKGGDLSSSADDPAGDGSAGRRRAANDKVPDTGQP